MIQAKTLRELTLRRCGISNSRNTLEQLTQLRRVFLDNTDIRDESVANVRSRLKEREIELIDITLMVDLASDSQSVQAVNEATALARRVHRELNYAKQHPSLWMKWHTDGGDVSSMKGKRIRTVNLLKQALDSDYVARPNSYSDVEYVMAWVPGELFTSGRYFKNREVAYEEYKYGDADLAWAREYRSNESSPRHFPRNGVAAFADELWDMPPQLRVSHQDFWWGIALHHNLTTSSISPEKATYRELPSETFGGEICRVLESPGRSERLWVSSATGRMLGLLTFIHQGYFTPFYRQPIVTKFVGREVQSQDEYRALSKTFSNEQQSKLNLAWAEYMFDSGIPGSLYSFSDYREISPQAWFPFEVRSSGWLHNKQNEQYYDFHVSIAKITELTTNRSDLKSLWAPLLPKEGESVQDQRFAAAVDYKYKYDRTAAEIEALVSDQLFKFAESQILIDERRNPLNELLNKPAMDLPVDGWLGERPDLKGKPYLLHYWATMFPYCVKVDAKGNIIKHGFLNDVLGTTSPISNRVVATNSRIIGRVIAIKSESRLIQFSLGTKDSIGPQQMLDIMRNGKWIGRLRVVLTKENQSVGIANNNEESPEIMVNDTVQP